MDFFPWSCDSQGLWRAWGDWRRHRCGLRGREECWSLHLQWLSVGKMDRRQCLRPLLHQERLLYESLVYYLFDCTTIFSVPSAGYSIAVSKQASLSCGLKLILNSFFSLSASREKAIIERGLESFSSVSCIRFRPYRNGDRDWISIESNSG